MQSYDERPFALFVWDMENVRLPDASDTLSISDLVSNLKNGFMDPKYYKEWRTTACITRTSLKAIEKRHPDFIDQMVPYIDITLASSFKKVNADYVLKRELSTFLDSHAASPHSRIILLSGDGDFLGCVQRAIKMGIEVHVVSYSGATSKVLQGAATRHYDWRSLLEEMTGGTVTLPYVTI